ncbi:hypothetical protein OESDEN_11456 [Oesophagostomum dentatum]|uniref:Uncharacterized protein n=1 Tax=Oesophagostomum dentatum TaxID=61180 RepID=A0A0B1SZ15_OESDE|nr:hypothetical protein OESDEN_11456 [Oesophagostomum dentatum]
MLLYRAVMEQAIHTRDLSFFLAKHKKDNGVEFIESQRDGHGQGVVAEKASLSRDGRMAQEEDTRTQQNESIVKDKFAAGVIQNVVTTYNIVPMPLVVYQLFAHKSSYPICPDDKYCACAKINARTVYFEASEPDAVKIV